MPPGPYWAALGGEGGRGGGGGAGTGFDHAPAHERRDGRVAPPWGPAEPGFDEGTPSESDPVPRE